MKAIVYEQYGSPDVLQLKEVEKPTPQDDELLVKIWATAVNAADNYLLQGKPFFIRFMAGLQKPKNKILGSDIAGRVEAVGKNVTKFAPGDEVFGEISGGGMAEYVAVSENALIHKPANITFAEAAAVPMAALTALQGLRKGYIQAGQKVLINGASGGVGTFAVQIAKSFGAEVTAVCSTSKIEMVYSIGADHDIDYTQENFSQNGKQYDLIFAANGYHPLADYKRALTPEGIYLCAGGKMSQIFQAMLLGPLFSIGGSKKLGSMGVAEPNQKDLAFMRDLLATGKVVPVIDTCYPLPKAADAMRHLGKGHAKGKIIITVAHNTEAVL